MQGMEGVCAPGWASSIGAATRREDAPQGEAGVGSYGDRSRSRVDQ